MPDATLPVVTAHPTLETEPFWAAAAEGRFVLPRCDSCRAIVWYPRRFCPICHTLGVSWIDASGRGQVYAFTVVRKAGGPWGAVAPYVIAYVELEEGPRVMTNIVGCDVDDVRCGMPVELVWERDGDAVIYRFTPSS
jgi:uncharacterized OB-fold protein